MRIASYLLLSLTLALLAIFPAPVAQAATFDIADGDVAGLIAAINTANGSAEADIINLAPGGTYTLTGVNNTFYYWGPSGLPVITSQITINGNGATIERSNIAGTPDFRILMISGGNAALHGVTIRGGRATQGSPNYEGGGGGIRNDGGILLLMNSTVSGNSNSTVTGPSSSAGQDGGGVFNYYGGALTVINSTISHNTSFGGYGGGGISNMSHPQLQPSRVTIINSTIFENRADGPGGFGGRGDAIADNFSPQGSIVIKNSILASPVEGKGNDFYFQSGQPGVVISLGHNIVGDTSGALAGTGDLNGVDPQLGPLADNGGLTWTHAPLPGSPVLNAVPTAECTDDGGAVIATDQRGVARPQGATCDIGSVEWLVPCDAADPAVHIGAAEVCGNGVDDDCDGHVDEGSASVTLQGWQAFSYVQSDDPDWGRADDTDDIGGWGGQPVFEELRASRGGGASHTQFSISASDVVTSWTHTVEPTNENAEVRTAYIVEFQVAGDSFYSLDGFYQAVGDSRMSAIIDLWDSQTGQRLFRQQIDGTTTNPSLVVGQDPAWPGYHTLTGSASGVLPAGDYRIDVDVFVYPRAGNGLQGQGALNLIVSPAWYADSDGDGYGDPASTSAGCSPAGYVLNDDDCDDTDAGTSPGARETCDGLDNNCDGQVDEDCACAGETGCNQPPVALCQYVSVAADEPSCAASASIDHGSSDPDAGDTITLTQTPAGPYPLGSNAVTLTVTDSHGASASCTATVSVEDLTAPSLSCPADVTATASAASGAVVTYPAPSASDPCSTTSVTCTSASGSTFPVGTTTVSCTATAGVTTSNCTFTVTVNAATWCQDADGDGYGDAGASVMAVDPPAGYVAQSGDCDDADPAVHIGAAEVCGNGVDDDCDGHVDEGSASVTLQGWQAQSSVESNDPDWGRAFDIDDIGGWGGQPVFEELRASRGGGASHTQFSISASDVVTSWTHTVEPTNENAEVSTSYTVEFQVAADAFYSLAGFYQAVGDSRMSAIIEFWDRQTGQRLFRQQIDGTTTNPSLVVGQAPPWPWYHGLTGSAFGVLPAGDYRIDVNVFVYPRAGNGLLGQGALNLIVSPAWYADSDGDGYGDPGSTSAGCSPAGHVLNDDDCDDTNAAVHPGATEVCDGLDNDCDGQVDETGCNQPPVANCQYVSVAADEPSCAASASIDHGSSDPDAGDTITLTQTPAGPYPLGSNAVTLTVTDSHGASASCTATVSVEDLTAPSLSCPADVTATASSASGAVVTYPAPAASDPCSTTSVTCTSASGSTFPVGTTTVSCTATAGVTTSNCTFTVTVNKAATTTTLTATPAPSSCGQAVTLTATVSSPAGAPDGTFTFFDGATALGTAPLANGAAVLAVATLPPGSHSLTASYLGATAFLPSVSPALAHTVTAVTTTSLASSVNPSVYGQPVTFTATVSSLCGAPTGNVQFYNGTTPLGTPKTLTGGKATLTMPDLLVKSNTIRATYGGAAGYLTSTTTLSQVVNKSATKTTLVASPNPSIKGQTVTFTATVSAVAPGGGLPTGTVQFYDGNKLLGTQQPLVSGTATFKYAGLPRGNHTITVIYGGTPNYKNSTSNSIVQIVK